MTWSRVEVEEWMTADESGARGLNQFTLSAQFLLVHVHLEVFCKYCRTRSAISRALRLARFLFSLSSSVSFVSFLFLFNKNMILLVVDDGNDDHYPLQGSSDNH